MDWKDSFNRNVLMQGWRRFQNHEMGPIMKNNNTYFVSSPEGYQTRAVIENGYVDSISCSCFRGRRGELCEHEAALLFALENNASSSRKTPDAPSKSPSKENRQIPHPNAYSRPEASPFGRTSRPVKEAPQTSWSHPDGPATPKVTPPSSDDSMPANPLLDELQKLFGLETPSAPIHPHEQAPKEESHRLLKDQEPISKNQKLILNLLLTTLQQSQHQKPLNQIVHHTGTRILPL